MRRNAVSDVDLDRRGEVIGLAGLLGSGRTERRPAVWNRSAGQGKMRIDGVVAVEQSPGGDRAAVRVHAGGSQDAAIIPDLSVRENVAAALQSAMGWVRAAFGAEAEAGGRWIKTLGIATAMRRRRSRTCRADQQKVILARWLASDPRLLILDEPTRGIDVGAAEIQKLILGLAREGCRSCSSHRAGRGRALLVARGGDAGSAEDRGVVGKRGDAGSDHRGDRGDRGHS